MQKTDVIYLGHLFSHCGEEYSKLNMLFSPCKELVHGYAQALHLSNENLQNKNKFWH